MTPAMARQTQLSAGPGTSPQGRAVALLQPGVDLGRLPLQRQLVAVDLAHGREAGAIGPALPLPETGAPDRLGAVHVDLSDLDHEDGARCLLVRDEACHQLRVRGDAPGPVHA